MSFKPQSTSVRRLRALRRPAKLGRRAASVEDTTYRVRATLVAMKIEDDQDVHLVIADPRNLAETMIVEFPAAACTRRASPQAQRLMRLARQALVARAGEPGTGSFTTLSGTATLTGVGLFDFKHRQRGVAPNAIELHPVIGFR